MLYFFGKREPGNRRASRRFLMDVRLAADTLFSESRGCHAHFGLKLFGEDQRVLVTAGQSHTFDGELGDFQKLSCPGEAESGQVFFGRDLQG